MKVYTKTGDSGETSLYDGSRAPKYAINFEVLGEMDELSSRIGMLCALLQDNETMEARLYMLPLLRKIQRTLQDFNSHIATLDPDSCKRIPVLSEDLVTELEAKIDDMERVNPKLIRFILPGKNQDDAQAHLCRTQARKTERALTHLHNTEEILTVMKKGERSHFALEEFKVPEVILKYMNRLSDFFFVLARYVCVMQGEEDLFCVIKK